MTRVAWISGALDSGKRDKLRREFDRVLSGTAEQRRAYLDAVDEAIDEYRKLYVPAERDAQLWDRRLERLAAGARAFAKAVTAVKADPDLCDLVELDQWIAAGKPVTIPKFKAIVDSAQIALNAADAADRIRIARRKKSGGPRVGAHCRR